MRREPPRKIRAPSPRGGCGRPSAGRLPCAFTYITPGAGIFPHKFQKFFSPLHGWLRCSGSSRFIGGSPLGKRWESAFTRITRAGRGLLRRRNDFFEKTGNRSKKTTPSGGSPKGWGWVTGWPLRHFRQAAGRRPGAGARRLAGCTRSNAITCTGPPDGSGARSDPRRPSGSC